MAKLALSDLNNQNNNQNRYDQPLPPTAPVVSGYGTQVVHQPEVQVIHTQVAPAHTYVTVEKKAGLGDTIGAFIFGCAFTFNPLGGIASAIAINMFRGGWFPWMLAGVITLVPFHMLNLAGLGVGTAAVIESVMNSDDYNY